MAKKKKEQDKRTVFRVTTAWGTEVRDYLISAEWYEIDLRREDLVHFYIYDKDVEHIEVASFRHWIAIENLKEAERWGEKFEKLARYSQQDMFLPKEGDMQELSLEEFGQAMKKSLSDKQ